MYGVLVVSLVNFIGMMMIVDVFLELVEYCEVEGIWFIFDEIYYGFDYVGE